MHWLYIAESMDLKTSDVQKRETGKGAHVIAVAQDAMLDSIARRDLFVLRFAPGKHYGSSHPLEVPLEWTSNCFVEVVNVKDKPAVGRGKGAKVANVGVAADLRFDPGVGNDSEVSGHDRSRSAKEDEGRLRHKLVFEFEQSRDAASLGALEKCKRRTLAALDVELVVFLSAELLAPRVSQIASFFRRYPGHRSGAPQFPQMEG